MILTKLQLDIGGIFLYTCSSDILVVWGMDIILQYLIGSVLHLSLIFLTGWRKQGRGSNKLPMVSLVKPSI
jgi:hypothetical protein